MERQTEIDRIQTAQKFKRQNVCVQNKKHILRLADLNRRILDRHTNAVDTRPKP